MIMIMVMITKDYITIPQCEYDFHSTQGSQNSRRLAITIYGYNYTPTCQNTSNAKP